LFLIWQGGWWLLGLLVVVMSLATWEYVALIARLGYFPSPVFAIGLVCAFLMTTHLGQAPLLPLWTALLLLSLAWHILFDRSQTRIENWLLPLGGALYIGWMSGHMLLLRALPNGAYGLVLALGITWVADTGAFFIGSKWGRRAMAPRLSPSKTWEGYAGSAVTGAAAGAALALLGGIGWGHGVALGLLLSLITPLGDLGVSMIKRQAGTKDSSKLIPGHGGMFDRVDSLLVAGVIGYYYYVWVLPFFS
jgi:phosphatidate cytidylyltransferase